jgi:hypothetical protein
MAISVQVAVKWARKAQQTLNSSIGKLFEPLLFSTVEESALESEPCRTFQMGIHQVHRNGPMSFRSFSSPSNLPRLDPFTQNLCWIHVKDLELPTLRQAAPAQSTQTTMECMRQPQRCALSTTTTAGSPSPSWRPTRLSSTQQPTYCSVSASVLR